MQATLVCLSGRESADAEEASGYKECGEHDALLSTSMECNESTLLSTDEGSFSISDPAHSPQSLQMSIPSNQHTTSSSDSVSSAESVIEPHMVEYNSLTGANDLFSTNPKVRVPGAIYIKNYISEDEEEKILQLIDSKKWCHEICRRTQMYGYTYYHTRHNIPTMQPKVESESEYHHLDLKEFDWLIDRMVHRDGLYKFDLGNPTQCLVNEYVGTQGISSHVDNPGPFGDIITLISLNKPIYMVLKLVENENIQTKILLEPRSLFVMKDDSRFKWKHGITHMKQVYIPSTGETLIRDETYRRISLTFRYIKTDGTKKVTSEDPNTDALW